MASRPFSNADPFLQLIVLFLLCFMSVGVFLLMGQGIVGFIWGVDLLENPNALSDYSNRQVVNINRVLLIFQHVGLFILPAIIFSKLSSQQWKNYVGFRYSLPQFFLGAVLLILLSFPLVNALAYVNQQFNLPEFLGGLEELFVSMEETAMQLTEAITGDPSGWILLFNIVVVALLPAFGEEMIFRGLVLPMFRKWTGNVHAGVWISALLFSAMHLQFYGFLPRLVLGALLGYLFVWSRSLWVPVLAHFTNNALALVLMFMIARKDIPSEVDEWSPDSGYLLWLAGSIILMAMVIYYILKYAKGWRSVTLGSRLQEDPPQGTEVSESGKE